MSDVTKIRVGIQSARELELEVEDGADFVKQLEAAMGNEDGLFWFTDTKGDRHGVVLEKLAFVEVEGVAHRRGVGFGLVGE